MLYEKRRLGSSFQLTGQVLIPTDAGGTLLLAKSSTRSRSDTTILNTDATNTVYIGNMGLDNTNGYPLAPGTSITRRFNGDIYAIAVGGSVNVAYITCED